MAKAELVFIPLAATGHLAPVLHLAKLLISRDEQLCITILIVRQQVDAKVNSYINSLAADTTPGIRFVDVPLPQSEFSSGQISPVVLISTLNDSQKLLVKDVVSQITQSGSSRLAGFVVDMFCTAMIDLANEFGVPTYVFNTPSAATLGLRLHCQSLTDDCNHDAAAEYKESERELIVPTYMNQVPAKLIPSSYFDKEGVVLGNARRFRKTKGIMVNTFLDLELHAIKKLTGDEKIPPIYPVGPLINFEGISHGSGEADSIMKWLDDQPSSSVIFLCFGSMGSFEADQVRDIAQALEQCKHRFLWSLRRPPLKGQSRYPSEYENIEGVLPEGFLQRTAGIGKVIGWAPQVQVLAHAAVGGFVSHCGWNSVLESVWCGVPIAVWPMYAEQNMNAFQIVKELGIAVEIKMDYRKDFTKNNSNFVKAEEIEDGIRRLMEPGSEIRKKVKEMKEKSRTSLMDGGSSYISLGQFIEDFHAVHQKI